MPINGKVKSIYDTLKGGGADVGTEQEFNDWFFAKGAQGYKNRKSVYDTLKGGGADAGASYEEFAGWLGLHAVKGGGNVVNKTKAASQSRTNGAASTPQQRSQGGQTDALGMMGAVSKWGQRLARDTKQRLTGNDKMTDEDRARMSAEVGGMMADVERAKQQTAKDYAQAQEAARNPWQFGSDKGPLQARPAQFGYYGSVNNKGEVQSLRDLTGGENVKAGISVHTDPATGEAYFVTENGEEYGAGEYQLAKLRQQELDRAKDEGALMRHQVETLSDDVEEAYEREARAQEERYEAMEGKMNPFLRSIAQAGDPMLNNGNTATMRYTSSQEMINLDAARSSLRTARQLIREADINARKGTLGAWAKRSFVGGLVRGFGDKFFDVSTWDFGMTDIKNGSALLTALNKADKKEPLTESEQALLDAKCVELAVTAQLATQIGRGYKAGQVTGEMAPFMLEMFINPAAKTGEAAVNKLVRYCLKRFPQKMMQKGWKGAVRRGVAAATARVAGDIAGSAIMTATTGLGQVKAGKIQNQIGDIKYEMDQHGNVHYSGRENEMTPEEAWKKSFKEQWKERGSEMIGGYFAPIFGTMGKITAKMLTSKAGQKVGGKALMDWINSMSASKFVTGMNSFLERTQWHGVGGEYFEEKAGDVLDALFIGNVNFNLRGEDGKLFTAENSFWNLDDNIDTLLGVSVFGGLMSAINSAGFSYDVYRARKSMRLSGAAGRTAFGSERGKDWESFDARLQSDDLDAVKEMLQEMLTSDDYTDAQRNAIVTHAKNVMSYRGYVMGEAKKEEAGVWDADKEADQQMWDDGYKLEDAEDIYNSRAARDAAAADFAMYFGEEAATRFAEDPGASLTQILEDENISEGAKNVARIYNSAAQRYNGVLARINDEIDERVTESDVSVDNVTDAGGNVRRATLTETDEAGEPKQVYIVSGEVVMRETGDGRRVVDQEASDKSIFVKDTPDGKPRQVDISEIASAEEPVAADEAKAEAAQQIEAEVANREGDKLDFGMSFEDGQTYEVEWNGQKSQVTVVRDNGDGTVEISIDGAEPMAASKEQVVEMVKPERAAAAENGGGGAESEAETGENGADGLNGQDGLNGPGGQNNQSVEGSGTRFTLSNQKAANGERFYQNVNGNIDLVDIPQEVFDSIGYTKAPLRLTESMVRHILDHHGKELHISTADEAISFVKDVMEHFDHIRLGDNGSLVFSIENGRNKTGRRAITILLNSDSGDFYGVKTSGYEVMRKLAKRPLLWERGVNMVSSSDAVTEPVTSLDDPQDGGQSGNASGQSSSLSAGKDTESSATVQGNGEKNDAMPMVEVKGKLKPDWSKATPARAHAYIYKERGLSRENADAFVENNLQAAASELEKRRRKRPEMGTDLDEFDEKTAEWKAKMDELQRRYDYWQAVKDEQRRVLEAEAMERAERDAVLHDEAVAAERADYEARKRAEAERRAVGNGNPMPAITEKWNNAAKVDGHRDEIMLPDGTSLKGHYVLHESGASSPSHNPETWQKTDGFPMDANGGSVNDRDYERDRDAQEHTRSIARQYDQRALQSVPVVSNDGVVLSGNGRTMAGELAARDNTDGAYVSYLREYAPKFGFTAEQVDGMQHPRVSFVPDEAMPYTAETFARFNQQEMKSQNKTEQAVKLGKTVGDGIFRRIVRAINGYDTLGDFYNDAEASLGAVYDLHSAGVIPQAQLAEMVDGVRGQEKLSAVGREFLENMLIGKAFESDPEVVRMLTAEPSMRRTVITALGEIVDNIALGGEWSLQGALADAVKLCFDARQGGARYGEIVSVFARQGVLFADPDELQTVADFNNATMLMLADVLNDKRVTLLKTTIQLYNDRARDAAAGQADLFAGGIESREDILRDVINFINENYGKRKEIEAARAEAVERRKAESVQQNGIDGGRSSGSEVAGEDRRGTQSQEEPTVDIEALSDSGGMIAEDKRRVLTDAEIEAVLDILEDAAVGQPTVPYERTEWDKLFGKPLNTPAGKVRMGEHQFGKLHPDGNEQHQDRRGWIGQIHDTLTNPNLIIEQNEPREGAERDYKYVFVKSFLNSNGESVTYFASVTVKKGEMEVVITNHFKRYKDIRNLLRKGKLCFSSISPSGIQTEANQPSLSVTTSETGNKAGVSAGKDTESSANIQENSGENAENQIPDGVQAALAAAELETDTEPTEAQKEAGNYKKGHVKIDGYEVTIEQPKGSVRRGRDASGKQWEQEMHNTYGYIRGTEGVDGDHIDVFLSDDPSQGDVFVIDQVNEDGSFDEHKVMYGFPDIESARKAYLSNYKDGWRGLGAITQVSKDEFKKWIRSSHRKTKPFAEYSSVKKEAGQNEGQPSKPTVKEGEDIVSAAVRIANLQEPADSLGALQELDREIDAAWDDYLKAEEDEKIAEKRSELERRKAEILHSLTDDELDAYAKTREEDTDFELQREQKRRHDSGELSAEFDHVASEQGEVSVPHKAVKLNPNAYAAKEFTRPSMNGVYHDAEGYGVVSDGLVLYYDKRLYDAEKKGKTVLTHNVKEIARKKGDTLESKYPKWRLVLPQKGRTAAVDFGALLDFLSGVEARKGKKRGSLDGIRLMLRLPNGECIMMDYVRLRKFAEGAANLGAREMMMPEDFTRPLYASSKHGGVLAMPIPPTDDAGNVYPVEYVYDMTEAGSGVAEAPQQAEAAEGGSTEASAEAPQEDGGARMKFTERAEGARDVELARRERMARAMAAEMEGIFGVPMRVITRPEDITNAQARRKVEEDRQKGTEDTKAWYDTANGEVCVYAPHVGNPRVAVRTYLHEVVGHKGLRGLFRTETDEDGRETNPGFDKLCDRVWEMMPEAQRKRFLNYPGVRSIADEQQRQRAAADEYMAHMAERDGEWDVDRSVKERVVHWLKMHLNNVLEKLGFDTTLTDDDVRQLIKASARRLEREKRKAMKGAAEETAEAEGGGAMFMSTEGDNSQADAELLREGYSEPAPAVERRRLTPKEQRQRDAYEARRFRNLHTFVDKTLDKLRIKDICDVYDSIDDVPGAQDMPSRRQHARGWYNPETGRITIVLRNHRNQEDVGLTILHEAVGHHGLRELFGERFDTFLDNVYGGAAPEIHSEINRMARERFERANSQLDSAERQRRMYDATELRRHVRAATEEYLAGLAERTDFRADSSPYYTWWDQIKRWFVEMLHDIGLPNFFAMGDITDNELRYVLWRSYKNLSEPGHYRNPWREAEDVSMQYRLKTGEFAEPAEVENGGGAVAEEGEVRFMMGDGAETFKERQRRAVEEKGVVMPGLNSAEVKVVDVPRHTYTGRWSEARDAAIEDAVAKYTQIIGEGKGQGKRVPIPQSYDNFGVSFTYNISAKSIKESVNPEQVKKSLEHEAPNGVHLAVLNHLDEVIGESIEVEEHPDYKKDENGERKPENGWNDDVLVHRFVGAITVDGQMYRVKTTMLEYLDKNRENRQYAYDVAKIEVLDESPNTTNGLNEAANGRSSLANILKNVEKSYDSGKLLLEESAKEDRKREIQNTQNGSGGGRANFMVSGERDAEYMDAVEKGDEEKAGRMVREAARRAMPETKVVDENGEPKVVLHGTPDSSFYEFDDERIGSNTDAGWLGRGFYFYGNNPEYARQYAGGTGRVLHVYLDISNPYYATSEDIERLSEANDPEVSRQFREQLEEEGYDGVFYNGDLNEEWVAFHPNQIKLSDPVTYDDAGNVIPLSERFNPEKDDIRFMSSEVDDGRTDEIMERAKKKFGLTDDVREAGYVLPDGGMLDFSGRNELDAGTDDSFLRGSRQEDHRRINSIAYDYDADGNEVETGVETDMRDFIRRGGIRIDAGGNVGIINLAVKPTEKQRAALRRLINLKGGNVDVDFGDGWNSDHYVEYDGAKAQRVLGDIDRYFDEGIKPEGNVRFMTELGDQSEEAREIYALPERYGLKGYADTACIRERDEIEQYQRYFPDDLIKGLYEEFDDPHSFGYHSNGVVVVFTGKIKPDDGEIVWWHEQTHNIYSKLSKEEREVYGKACLDYLKKNNTKLYNHILSEYPKEEWLDEACAYFIGNAIDEYGAYAFLNFNLEGREDIINFVTTFRNHIKYGEGTREKRGNQLRQRFQEAEDSSFLHTLQERGSQSQELEGGAGQEDSGGSGSRAGQEGEQPGDRVRFMSDEGGEAEESEVRDESEGGEAEGSETEGGRTAEEEAAEAVAMEPVEPAEMSLKEQVLQGLMAAAERYRQSGTMRTAAVSEISAYVASLQNAWRKRKGLNKEALEQTIGAKVRRGMSWQKAEDQALVEQTVRLAKLMLQGNFAKGLTPGEVKRLMGYIQTAVGRPTDAGEGRRNAGTQDPVAAAKSIVDLLALNQLRTMKGMVSKMMQVKTSKVNSLGVEVQAGLDLKGQVVVKAMREALQLSEDDLGAMVGELRDAMGSEDPITAENAALRWQGYMLAVEYNNQVRDSESEEKQLFRELRAAEQVRYPNRKRPVRKDGSVGEVVSDEDAARYRAMTGEQYKEWVESMRDGIRRSRLERMESLQLFIQQLGGRISESVARAQEARDREVERVREIQHNANSDLKGMPALEQRKETRWDKFVNWAPVQFFNRPLANFDMMLRFLGERGSVDGRGYLWNRFMGGWMQARAKEQDGVLNAFATLDKKAQEVFGRKKVGVLTLHWSDIPLLLKKKGASAVRVSFWNGDGMVESELSQGNIMYIYMVNKMEDGRMKLRRMGIGEEAMAQIEEQLDPRLKELADWLQGEYLPQLRMKYNEVHERLFGVPMAAIDDYFPLRINKNSLKKEEDVGAPRMGEQKPSTYTGAVIKRKRNTASLDLLGTDAMDVMLDHIQEMEHWAAFAELNRDMNTLLSYGKFRNRVKNMASLRFGSGEKLWSSLQDVFEIAAGVYRPKAGMLDKSIANVAKGVTSAKISLRVFTAEKQLLSYPAFWSNASAIELARAGKHPIDTWKWAMENLPDFRYRWGSRIAGDSRLLESDADWKVWKKAWIKRLQKAGMSANAAVDAFTVSQGAKAVYETAKKRYLKEGYSAERADELAKRDAVVCYNESQQSSENAFLSAMQLDRTASTVAFTVFRNGPMGYQRRFAMALARLKNKLTGKIKKADAIEFMTKQLVRDGLDEARARKAAESRWERSTWKDLTDVAVFGYICQLTWNAGAYLNYIIFGDDGDDKWEMVKDCAWHAIGGGVEGLTGGNLISDNTYAAIKSWFTGDKANMDWTTLPLASDIENLSSRFDSDKIAFLNDLINLGIQMGVGTNPQTVADIVYGVYDAFHGGDFETAQAFKYAMLRIICAPQSQVDKLWIDELGLTKEEAGRMTLDQLARHYANYKMNRNAPWTSWAYGDARKDEIIEKHTKKLMKMVDESLEGADDETLKRLLDGGDGDLAAHAAKRVYEDAGLKKGSTKTDYGKRYDALATYEDVLEDVLLKQALQEAGEDSERGKAIKRLQNRIRAIKRGKDTEEEYIPGLANPDGDEEDIMRQIRGVRAQGLRELGIR